MSIVFLFGAVQALFFVVLVLSKKEKHTSDYLLISWLVVMGLQLIGYYAVHEGLYDSYLFWPVVLLLPPLIYAHGPLLYLYTISLTSSRNAFPLKKLLHFIPLLVSFCYYLYLLIFKADGDFRYFATKPTVSAYLSIAFYLLNIFLNPVYVVIALFKIADHQRKIRMNFSYLEKINLNWLKLLAIGLGTVSLTVWIVHIISNLNVIDSDFSRDFWIFLAVTIFVFVAGYFGFKQGVIYKFTPQSDVRHSPDSALKKAPSGIHSPESKKYEKSQLSQEEVRIILHKLNHFMVEEKAFIKSDLSLMEVSTKMEISPHTLSQLLNVFVRKNFFNYVNEQRVNLVKQMLTDSNFDKYSLLGIAEDAGFNSKSSFNRIFKKETGMTPTQYKILHGSDSVSG
jgi:AraC-like DNA-binding protein